MTVIHIKIGHICVRNEQHSAGALPPRTPDPERAATRSFAADRAVCWSLRFRPLGVARAHPGRLRALPRAVPRRRRPLQRVAGWPGSNHRKRRLSTGLIP